MSHLKLVFGRDVIFNNLQIVPFCETQMSVYKNKEEAIKGTCEQPCGAKVVI